MIIPKELFSDLHEKFDKAIKLTVDDSKHDPENEPYKSKYAAKEILKEIKEKITHLLRNAQEPPKQLSGMLAAIELHLGTICIDTQELSAGEIHLIKCQELLNKDSLSPEFVLIALNMYNQFGILWSLRDQSKSQTYLEKAEETYKNYKTSQIAPVDIADLFNPDQGERDADLAWKYFEKEYTLTLFYLAQIYTTKDVSKCAIYCHWTLKRQLDAGDYDPIDWALNAATFSQFFLERSSFKQARNYLSASSFILDKYRAELDQITERNEAYDAKMEEYKHRSADVARCWAKYGILLLGASKERLLNRPDHIDANSTSSDLEALKLEPDSTDSVSGQDLQDLTFDSLDLSKYEMQISHNFVLTIQDARLVFLNVKGWLEKAELYYTLENQASDHIEIVQDMSRLYDSFLFFDDDTGNQAKLHKRRIDLLENIIHKISSKHYMNYCRQIWFDLGETYFEILYIKIDKLKECDRPKPEALSKINSLVEKAICNYTNFISSYRDERSGELPVKLDANSDQKAYLRAYFSIGSLYNRFLTMDKGMQLKYLEECLKNYKFVYDYCETHAETKELISVEYGLCKEMVNILPLKIAKLRQEI